MKEIYSQQTLNEFFEEFKNLPNSYKIEQVHQLLNNPNAKATHRVKTYFKHLKLIIMTSAFIIGITTLLLNTKPVKQVKMESSYDGISEHIEYSVIKKGKFNHENISNSVNSEIKKNPSETSNIIKEYKNTKSEKSSIINLKIGKSQSDIASSEQVINKSEINENLSKSDGIPEKESPFIEVPILNLSKSEMENLGFMFYKDSVVFLFADGCNKYKSSIFKLYLKNDSAKIIDEKYLSLGEFAKMKNKGEEYFTIIQTTTQICGKMSLKDNTQIFIRALTNYNNSEFPKQIWRYDEDRVEGYYPEMSLDDIDLNLLVPVKCNTKDSELNLMFLNQVFWMYPNDELFLRLPKEISKELKQEFNLLTKENLSIENAENSCTFYEVCKSTLQLENFKLYPNPANYSVTIEFNLDVEVEGSISIVNIAGARLKTLVPNSTFLSGHNSYQMDLSGITPGIYLISINTERGFKTQRLIVSQ